MSSQAALCTDTPAPLLRMLDSVVVHQALYAAASLGIADLLLDQPRTTADLAHEIKVNEEALYRILRALAGEDIFEETAPRTFANNELSRFLATGVPGSVRSILVFKGSSYFFGPFVEILYTKKTGESARTKILGMNGFEYLRQHPEIACVFDDAMTNISELSASAIASVYDFGRWGSLMEVGGGNGILLAAILKAHRGLRGVLAEQPHVLERARQRGFLGLHYEARDRRLGGWERARHSRELPESYSRGRGSVDRGLRLAGGQSLLGWEICGYRDAGADWRPGAHVAGIP